jgi:hypothetical protein
VGRRRTSHSGLVLAATSGLLGRDLQASGLRFLSVLSAGRERPGVMPRAGTGLRM